jgi:hypothetical protein
VVKKQDLKTKQIGSLVRACRDVKSCTLITDQFTGCVSLQRLTEHKTVNHKVWYVSGDTHAYTIESFWAILKRGVVGQSHKVSLKHLPKYIDEFCYRYNERKTDGTTLSNQLSRKD